MSPGVDASLRSKVPAGPVLDGWRLVVRWVDMLPGPIDVFGGVEGFTTYFPRIDGG
jgi:hypothetical protein